MAESSLKDKTAKAASWNIGDKVANYAVSFLIGIVLARLLSPEEYGLIGIIGIFIAIFNLILDSGLQTALLRKKDVFEKDYCTVFYTNLVLSLLLTFILYFVAPFLSDFFERPELTPYTRVMSFVLILNALSITQQTRLTKKLDFKAQTKISIIAHLVSGVIGIVMAFSGMGVWALVAQHMTSRFMTTLLLWINNKWIPKLIFSIKSFKELFGFGWKILVATIIGEVWNQLYQTVIGKCYNPATLGYYTRAKQYSSLFSSAIGDVVLKVSLPALSTIQDDDAHVISAYKQIIKVVMFITFILMLGMAACSKSLIYVLIGEKWMPSVPIMQIICFYLMLYPLHMININMLTLQGRSDIQLYLQIIKIGIATIPLILGIFVGIYWMLWGSVLTGIISFFLNSYYSGKKYRYSSFDQLKDLAPSFGVSCAMAIPVYALSFLTLNPFILLPIQLVVGFGIVILLCEKTHLDEYEQAKELILNIISKLKLI